MAVAMVNAVRQSVPAISNPLLDAGAVPLRRPEERAAADERFAPLGPRRPEPAPGPLRERRSVVPSVVIAVIARLR